MLFERPKLYAILTFLSAIGLRVDPMSRATTSSEANENSCNLIQHQLSFSEKIQGAFIRINTVSLNCHENPFISCYD